ncbi:MAG: DUF998 domain-containing protein [Acidimicrobiia bacterium]|nr:DUF998 domain-containing protein [Acidimicrobiia bacterium]
MNTSSSTQIAGQLGWLAFFGVFVFVAGIVVAGLAYDGYSHVDQMISELGGADATRPWIQNINFALVGLTTTGLAIGLMIDAGRVFLGAVLVAVMGISGTILNGTLHCDSGCEGATTEGLLHLMTGLVGFLSMVVGLFFLIRHFRQDSRWAGHVRFTRISAWATLAGFLLFAASDGVPEWDGLAQRIFVLPVLVFVAVTGWRLAHIAAAAPGTDVDPSALGSEVLQHL